MSTPCDQPNMPRENHASPRQPAARISTAAAVLWASAFVIAAMVIVQAGRLPGARGITSAAHAEMAISHGNYTLLTTESGRGGGEDGGGHELLYIIDSREQALLVYEIEDARRNIMTLRDGGSIDNLFRAARR